MPRIDVHHHFIPDFYRSALQSDGPEEFKQMPPWSKEASLKQMKELNIDVAIVAIPTPGCTFLSANQAVNLSRQVNDYGIELSKDSRFKFWATLPIDDVDASIIEAKRVIQAGAIGVCVMANTNGKYLGCKELDPLMKVLNEYKVAVHVHPNDLPGECIEELTPNVADFLLDTTRAACILVKNNVIRNYPDIKFILSHGGGFLPYQSERLAITLALPLKRPVEDVIQDFKSFYFDTALTADVAFPTLLKFAKPGHVCFGTDYPFAPLELTKLFASHVDGLDEEIKNDVDNAGNVFINKSIE